MTDVLTNVSKSPTFTPEQRSQAFWTQHENRPLLGNTLSANQQIQEYERRRLVQTIMPSGFMAVGDRTIKTRGGSDIRVGDLVVGATSSDSNVFYIYAPDEEYVAFVNGWTITLYNIRGNGASSSINDDYLAIDMGTAPATGHRFDFAFLEVWKEELSSSDDLARWGNVDSDESDFANDASDSRQSGTYNAIVVINSRIRVVQDIDYAAHPFGLNDTANVYARGGAGSVSTQAFSYQGRGLWRAGSGNDTSRTALGSIDGYSYAIPIAVVSRRNRANYNASSNPNGAEAIGTTATRPDGLSYDEIAAADVDDLRPQIGTFLDKESLIRDTRDRIAANALRLGLRQEGATGVWGNEILKSQTFTGNGSRRSWSDVEGLDKVPSAVHGAVLTDSGTNQDTTVIIDEDASTSNLDDGYYGILLEGRSRSITNVVVRSGSSITNHTPSSGDTITLNYSYRPSLTPPLPSSLSVEMVCVEPVIVTSNLGTGGGNKGQPYLNPMLHTPESTQAHSSEPSRPDDEINNDEDLVVVGFGGNWGVIDLPAMWQAPWRGITSFTNREEDNEDRPYYGRADQTYLARGATLIEGQWHRTAQYGLARVTTTNDAFLQDELVLVCFSETTDSTDNKVGVLSGEDSAFAVGVYPLRVMV